MENFRQHNLSLHFHNFFRNFFAILLRENTRNFRQKLTTLLYISLTPIRFYVTQNAQCSEVRLILAHLKP